MNSSFFEPNELTTVSPGKEELISRLKDKVVAYKNNKHLEFTFDSDDETFSELVDFLCLAQSEMGLTHYYLKINLNRIVLRLDGNDKINYLFQKEFHNVA
jgi:hypothetical protein